MSARSVVAALFAGAIAFVALAPRAHAYPQWQLSHEARCDECHFAPAGGGLINAFGRDFVGEELSTFGGNGAVFHGGLTLPAWLALGAELRGALASQDVADLNGTSTAVFPMQADAEGRFALGSFSFYGVLGFREQIRANEPIVPTQNYQPISTSQLISREHWFMLRASALGGYVRVGRFFAPFGLRMAEHILYVRRDLGFGTMEESYNLSSGYVADKWELHATAFAPDFLRQMGSREGGVTLYYERRFADVASAAAQARVAIGPGMVRTIVGGVGKAWVAPIRTLFLAEADFVRRDIDTVSPSYQFVGVGGFSVLPFKGFMGTFLQERNQVDFAVASASYDATNALVSWFPYAHFELQALGRLQFPSGGQSAKTFFVQLHYFL
jgi:hypothetical protein